MTGPEPLDALDALLDELSARGHDIDDRDGDLDDGAELGNGSELGGAGEDSGAERIEPAYDNVSDWVIDWFLPTVERRYAQGSRGGVYWCDLWWAHPEGLQRIYALWREWERARVEDTMSHWWRDHLDQHLHALCGENGAFVACSPGRHYAPSLLPGQPLPAYILRLLPEGEDQPPAQGSDLFVGEVSAT